jgi:sortase A
VIVFENTARLLAQALARSGGPNAMGGTALRRISSRVLLISGGCLVLFTLGAYSWMSLEQHRLTNQLKAQAAEASRIQSGPAGSAHDNVAVPDHGVTLLSIPKIHLQAAVLEGTDSRTLLLAPGHLKKTALPGDPGNSVIAGHRDTFFRHVYELNPGDVILVQRRGRQYRYVVISKSIVDPQDTSVASSTHDTRLTLVTCYPTYYIGPAPERAIVVATLQSDTEPTRVETVANPKPRS